MSNTLVDDGYTLVGPTHTPNATLLPLNIDKRRKMIIEIEVGENFENRLDNQWEVEREIHADRWSWRWADERPNTSSNDRRLDPEL